MANTKRNHDVTPEDKTKADIVYDHDSQQDMVRGQFLNREMPGGTHEFMYCTDPDPNAEIVKYSMVDGEWYTVPKEVADHLNRLSYPVHRDRVDNSGKRFTEIGKWVKRFGFIYPGMIEKDTKQFIVEPSIIVGPSAR